MVYLLIYDDYIKVVKLDNCWELGKFYDVDFDDCPINVIKLDDKTIDEICKLKGD